jgi:nicotinate-nucleotide--dimethylbenzimidazole phosphoribosyltransferase
MIGAAARRRVVLVDGFISGAAALLATLLSPACRDYLLASHLSTEPGHRLTLAHLRLEPLLDLRLRLGEGTGAALALPVLDAACSAIAEMATFEEAGVSGMVVAAE